MRFNFPHLTITLSAPKGGEGGLYQDGAATAVGMLTLAARFRRSGAIYRNHGSDRDSPLEVNIGPGVSAT